MDDKIQVIPTDNGNLLVTLPGFVQVTIEGSWTAALVPRWLWTARVLGYLYGTEAQVYTWGSYSRDEAVAWAKRTCLEIAAERIGKELHR